MFKPSPAGEGWVRRIKITSFLLNFWNECVLVIYKGKRLGSNRAGLIRQHKSKILIIGRLIDTLVIGVTLWAVLKLERMEWSAEYTWWLLISIFSFQVFAEFNDLYGDNRGRKFTGLIKSIIISWICAVFVLSVVDQFNQVVWPTSKEVYLFWCIAVPVELISWYVIVNGVVSTMRRMGRNTRKVAIIGDSHLASELRHIFINEDWIGFDFIGFFDDRIAPREQREANKIEGNLKELIEKAKQGEVDSIYITLPMKAENRIKSILAELSDTTASVYYVPDLFVFDLLSSNLSYLQGIPVVSIHDTPFYGVDGVLKRMFDMVIGSIILVIIAVPMLVIAICIKLSSPGEVIFKQRRYGFRGEKIVVWKFRSMSVSENSDDVQQAQKNDPRVTKLGAILRRTSLDELPQFINVLQGRMSIVGPRPHAVAHNELYRGQIKGYMLRHKVKPGITGLAQISGFRGETDTLDKMEGRVKYDLQYIRNWSLWGDFKIVFLTIFKGFSGDKAY